MNGTFDQIRKSLPLPSAELSWTDIQKMFERLDGIVQSTGEEQLAKAVRPPGITEQDFEHQKDEVRQAFKVTVTVRGRGGVEMLGNKTDLFTSANLPESIESVFMTNTTAFQLVAQRRPPNSFSLFIDFTKPPLLDARNVVSAPTANSSNLEVIGDSRSWVPAIHDAVIGILQNRRTRRGWLHGSFVYDWIILLVGLPTALYVAWRLSSLIGAELASAHYFLAAAAYVYVVLLVLWIFRVIFGYSKWAFPLMELSDQRSATAKHRTVLGALLLAIVGTGLYDFVKGLF